MLSGIGQVTLERGESHKIDLLETWRHVGSDRKFISNIIFGSADEN
jgi:hypothetical protein